MLDNLLLVLRLLAGLIVACAVLRFIARHVSSTTSASLVMKTTPPGAATPRLARRETTRLRSRRLPSE